jgi:superfamily II DNA or RNA helicase
LKSCADLVGEIAISVTGEDSRESRLKASQQISSGEKKVLFGTQSIFSEGISINELSCLVLGTPVNNTPLLTQLIGRIVRVAPNKLQPTIIDIHLKGKTATRQAQARMAHYIKEGYAINVL